MYFYSHKESWNFFPATLTSFWIRMKNPYCYNTILSYFSTQILLNGLTNYKQKLREEQVNKTLLSSCWSFIPKFRNEFSLCYDRVRQRLMSLEYTYYCDWNWLQAVLSILLAIMQNFNYFVPLICEEASGDIVNRLTVVNTKKTASLKHLLVDQWFVILWWFALPLGQNISILSYSVSSLNNYAFLVVFQHNELCIII